MLMGHTCIFCDDPVLGHVVCAACRCLICFKTRPKACGCGNRHTEPSDVNGYCKACTESHPEPTRTYYMGKGGKQSVWFKGELMSALDAQKRGRSARAKGARVEREIVKTLQEAGIPAEKISRTGHTGDDIKIADEFSGEVKARKNSNGFRSVETWKRPVDVLFLKGNHQPPLAVVDLDFFTKLMAAYLKD